MNGAQALFKALTDAGLDTCFANPGTSETQLVYEIGTTEGVRAVLWLRSFREFPPRMKPGSFSLDRVMEKMTKPKQN